MVPSRGAAEQIALELIKLVPGGIAGVRLRTIDDLARSLVAGVRVATDAERRLAMRLAIRSVDHAMMESRGVASMLERSYRDVRDSGLTLADFARRASSARGLRNARRTEAILRAWTEYERLIAQLGAIDPAELLARAARAIDSRVKPQLLAGFYDMTGAQWQIVAALRAADRLAAVWIPTTERFAQPFIDRFDERIDSPPAERRTSAAVVLQYDAPFAELRDVCRRVRDQLDANIDPREIGIVARSFEPYDVRLLHRFAEEFGFRTTLEDEIKLPAHRLGRGAITLLRLRERDFPRGDVLELVRDGLHTQTKIHVDAVDAATRRARIAGGTTDELKPMRGRSPVIDSYIALVAELETLTRDVITDFGSMFRVETELDLDAAEELDQVAALLRPFGRAVTANDVIDAIEHVSLARRTTRDGGPPVIWAGDVMRFRGRAFEHLHLVRMQDDLFPQRRTEDPLLPDPDRRILNLREIGDGRDEEQLLFSLVNAEVISFAAGDGFGKVLRPSRYLRTIARDASQPARPAARNAQPGGNSRRQLQLLARAGTRSPFDGYLRDFTPALESLSPTQLEDFGECPQKFLLKHILRVEDIDDPERELQIHHREKGTIDHQILEQFYRNTPEDELHAAAVALPRLPDPIIERLETLIDQEFDKHEREYPPFNRTVRDIERRATKRILREFVAHDLADLAAQELVPRWFEYRFGRKHREKANHPEPFVVDTGATPVRVEGTIDRIDVGTERFRIVDYKSGKAARHANLGDKIDRGVRLQLALYAMAAAEFFAADPATVSGTIKPLVLGDIKADKYAFALHEKRDGLLETLRIFMRAIAAGAFPAFPNENDLEFNSCKYCPVNHSCRTKHDADERYALQQLSDPRTLLERALRGDS